MAYRKSEHPRIVQIVQPRVLSFWDRSKMTPYHNKLLGEFAYYIYILQILEKGLEQDDVLVLLKLGHDGGDGGDELAGIKHDA